MIRWLAAILAAGLLLSACGSQSLDSAMKSWVSQSNYVANNSQLITDAQHSVAALRVKDESNKDLHTVCAVMYLESDQAGAALPTPDTLVTKLLGDAYIKLNAGANVCYDAGSDSAKRALAISDLSKGVGSLDEAYARIKSDTSSSSS
ncbi:MAG: hypothetical protein WCA31_09285 [Acidimicrobiales bacterium]